jgi:hypothetical protein
MTLIVDRGQTVPGPGLHALIVGVSDYTHLPSGPADPAVGFGMAKLASPALSAFRIYRWLTAPPRGTSLAAPLKTCRLLLAPSPEELAAEPALAGLTLDRPTWKAFQKAAVAWRTDASSEPKDVTLFYFAGHGLRTTPEESILTLEDFGEPGLPETHHCAKVGNLRQGMAPTETRPGIARTQFYFIDACRNLPEQVLKFAPMSVPDVFKVELNVHDTRATPTFFATADGGLAISRRGRETVFCEALLDALSRGAEASEDDPASGAARWPVTSITLKRGVDRYLLRKHGGAAPEVDPRGMMREPALLHLAQPPEVDIDLEVTPAALAGEARIALVDADARPAFDETLGQTPLTRSVPAGIYRAVVRSRTLPADYRSGLVMVNQILRLPWRIRTEGAGV